MISVFQLVLMSVLTFASWGHAEVLNLKAENHNLESGIAIKGYDPVSYFQATGPLKGDKNISHTVEGVQYFFATQENKAKFATDPGAFAPQYGGWCATAVAGGYKYDIEPKNFKITGNKLYLFYKGFLGDAKKDWVKSEPEQILKADKNWPEVSQKSK